MAEKRMISKVISISKKFNVGIDDHFTRMLYLMLIPHSDDFGKLVGDPFKVKALVLPMMEDVSWRQVEESLRNLDIAQLIQWYEVDGDKYIRITNFDEHQTGLHKRTRSKFPEPTGKEDEIPGSSRNVPEIPSELKRTELNRTEEKGREEKGEEEPAHVNDEHEQQKESLRKLCVSSKILGFTTFHLDIVYSYLGTAEIKVIEAAIKKSEGKPNTYLINTLDGMINRDKITRADQLPGAKEDSNGRVQEGVRQGSNAFDDKPITGGKSGVLPSKWFNPDDVQVS